MTCLSSPAEKRYGCLGDDGSMKFWDWKTGYNFQTLDTIVQPGSMDSESAIYASTFDKSGSRFITCEADKSIKIYKEDEDSTDEDLFRFEVMLVIFLLFVVFMLVCYIVVSSTRRTGEKLHSELEMELMKTKQDNWL